MLLDYQHLVEDYERSLFHVLRGQRTLDLLETWVPDPDVVRSLLNLFEAAQGAECDSLSVQLSPPIALGVDEPALHSALADLGVLHIERSSNGLVVSLSGLGKTGHNLPSVYDDSLTRFGKNLAHAGAPAPIENTVQVTVDSCTLYLSINEQQVIERARFECPRNSTTARLLEALADLCEGLPIYEAADHGAIRLEARLRGDKPAPVSGIVLPENSDPMFGLVQRLLRGALSAFQQIADHQPAASHAGFIEPLSPLWLSLSQEEQLRAVNAALAAALCALGRDPQALCAIHIEHETRAVVQVAPELPTKQLPALLMRLETEVRKRVEPTIELLLAEVQDNNKVRRL